MIKPWRYVQAVYSFIRLIGDLRRTDEVFEVVSGIESPKYMEPIRQHLLSLPGVPDRMKARARVGSLELSVLSKLPPNSLGFAYAAHLNAAGLDPYFFPRQEVSGDYDYMRVHLYESHDIWHVLTGFSTDVAGELGLQAFYAAQLKVGFLAPILIAAGLLNAVFFEMGDLSRRFDAITAGWHMGKSCSSLFGVPWAQLWSQPLVDVRREFRIVSIGMEGDGGSSSPPMGAAVG